MTKERLEEIKGEIDQRASNAGVLAQLLDCLIEAAPEGDKAFIDGEVIEDEPNDAQSTIQRTASLHRL